MTDHFYWFWLIFLLYPLARIAQRFFRKRQVQNYNVSSEKSVGTQFKATSRNTMEKPARNLARPESKEMMIMGQIIRGYKTFGDIRKKTGYNSEDLNSILEDLEKRGLLKVEQKKGMLGIKVEMLPTEKGYREYDA